MSVPSAIDTLARTLYGEARGEGTQGMQAVACVILNRVAIGGWWGTTIEDVCRKPWQFSCWNECDPNHPIIHSATTEDAVFAQACRIASAAVQGELPDITRGATSYYDRRLSPAPYWAAGKQPCAVLGHHLFFNDI